MLPISSDHAKILRVIGNSYCRKLADRFTAQVGHQSRRLGVERLKPKAANPPGIVRQHISKIIPFARPSEMGEVRWACDSPDLQCLAVRKRRNRQYGFSSAPLRKRYARKIGGNCHTPA